MNKTIKRIETLLRFAVDKGASKNEKEIALKRAKKLIEIGNISEFDFSSEETKKIYRKFIKPKSSKPSRPSIKKNKGNSKEAKQLNSLLDIISNTALDKDERRKAVEMAMWLATGHEIKVNEVHVSHRKLYIKLFTEMMGYYREYIDPNYIPGPADMRKRMGKKDGVPYWAIMKRKSEQQKQAHTFFKKVNRPDWDIK